MSQLSWFIAMLCGVMTLVAISLQLTAVFSTGSRWVRNGLRGGAFYTFWLAVFIAGVWFLLMPAIQAIMRAPR